MEVNLHDDANVLLLRRGNESSGVHKPERSEILFAVCCQRRRKQLFAGHFFYNPIAGMQRELSACVKTDWSFDEWIKEKHDSGDRRNDESA